MRILSKLLSFQEIKYIMEALDISGKLDCLLLLHAYLRLNMVVQFWHSDYHLLLRLWDCWYFSVLIQSWFRPHAKYPLASGCIWCTYVYLSIAGRISKPTGIPCKAKPSLQLSLLWILDISAVKLKKCWYLIFFIITWSKNNQDQLLNAALNQNWAMQIMFERLDFLFKEIYLH